MGTILYEASFQFHFMYILPILFLIAFAIAPVIIIKTAKSKGNKCNLNFLYIIFGCLFIYVALFSAIIFVAHTHMYNHTVVAYEQGDYEIVEGYVENFDPMPYSGHKHESFEINGIKFEYSDYSVQFGYNNTKSHGGVITGNGQHLKIGYVEYSNSYYGNIIVYIEELP